MFGPVVRVARVAVGLLCCGGDGAKSEACVRAVGALWLLLRVAPLPTGLVWPLRLLMRALLGGRAVLPFVGLGLFPLLGREPHRVAKLLSCSASRGRAVVVVATPARTVSHRLATLLASPTLLWVDAPLLLAIYAAVWPLFLLVGRFSTVGTVFAV